MTLKLAALFSLALVAPGLAEEMTLKLPGGEVSVTHEEFEATFSAGGRKLTFDSGYLPEVRETWKDSALVYFATGGTGCPGLFAWITLDEEGSPRYRNLRHLRRRR